jgi:endoglucanase Acf2
MKCGLGTDFTITYPFTGVIPELPAPAKTGLANDYDPDRESWYLQQAATKAEYGNDTYWGGKNLTQMADYMWEARETHDASFEPLRAHLTAALSDWYTYTPGEKAHYFALYPSWKALIGFKTSYGSEAFNDNHFHYGYFTRSTALLGMVDPKFLKAYGPMATLVAKQYANWDRSDTRFPFLRTYDIWEGHSWASGLSSPTGDNQESSSEAVQSWVGLFLLGQALGDKAMTAAGAMGYAIETQAIREYWLDEYQTNFPKPNYQHNVAGMVWSGGNLYGTYFSGDPAWIYGIQWLPLEPGLQYLTHNPDYARKAINDMLQERAAKGQPGQIAGMGSGLGNVILSYAAMVNPDWVADQFAQLWAANDPIAKANDTGGLTYYELSTYRVLGRVSWDYHVDLPCSCVYYNSRTQAASYVAYNPGPTAVKATVYKGTTAIGTFDAAPGVLTRVTGLQTVAKQASK